MQVKTSKVAQNAAKTNTEIQAAFKERQNKKGIVKKCYWATAEQHKSIKKYVMELTCCTK